MTSGWAVVPRPKGTCVKCGSTWDAEMTLSKDGSGKYHATTLCRDRIACERRVEALSMLEDAHGDETEATR